MCALIPRKLSPAEQLLDALIDELRNESFKQYYDYSHNLGHFTSYSESFAPADALTNPAEDLATFETQVAASQGEPAGCAFDPLENYEAKTPVEWLSGPRLKQGHKFRFIDNRLVPSDSDLRVRQVSPADQVAQVFTRELKFVVQQLTRLPSLESIVQTLTGLAEFYDRVTEQIAEWTNEIEDAVISDSQPVHRLDADQLGRERADSDRLDRPDFDRPDRERDTFEPDEHRHFDSSR